MDGKRGAQQQGGPPAKRGPSNPDFEDDPIMDEDDYANMLPDDLDKADAALGEAGRNWKRPQVADFDPQRDSLGGLWILAVYHGCFLCVFAAAASSMRPVGYTVYHTPAVQFQGWQVCDTTAVAKSHCM